MLRSIKKLTLVSNPACRGMGRCIQSNVVAGRYFIRDRSLHSVAFNGNAPRYLRHSKHLKNKSGMRFSTFRSKGAADSGASGNSVSSATLFTVCLTSCVGFASAAHAASTPAVGDKTTDLQDEDDDEDDDDEPVDKSGLEDQGQEKGINPMRRAKIFCGGSNHKLAEEVLNTWG